MKINIKLLGISLFGIVLILALSVDTLGMMTPIEFKTTAVLALAIILWLFEPIPQGATAMLILVLPYLLRICSMKEMLSSFANPTLFFVLGTFGLSAAVSKVPLSKRILLLLLKTFGGSVNKILLAFMISTALISSIMSNIPATLMFMGIALDFLSLYDNEDDRKRTGRAIMVSLPIAGMIGGCITPAGSSNNVLVLSLLEEYSGTTISFVKWIIICGPIALVMLPIAWLLIVRIFKPVAIKKDKIDTFINKLSDLKKPDKKEIQVMIITAIMIICWVLSSWVPKLDTTVIAVLGTVIMFLPGIELFTWKDFNSEVSWCTILMTGSVLCLGNLILKNGIAAKMTTVLFDITSSASMVQIMVKLTVFMFILQIVIPNGPAAISTSAIPVMIAASAAGFNPAIFIIPVCLYCSWAMILPLNPVPMLTYSTGYYKMYDIGKVGVPILLITSFINLFWMPFITNLLL